MRHLSRITILLSLILFAAACSSDPAPSDNNTDNNANVDANLQDTDNTQDTAPPKDLEEPHDLDDNTDTLESPDTLDNTDTLENTDVTEPPEEDCTVTVELSNSLLVTPTTWPTAIAADSEPVICWTTPQDATLPSPEKGWNLIVQREDTAFEDFESSEWRVSGLAVETRQAKYGYCDDLQAKQCTTATPLSAGQHFIHLLEPDNPSGLAASLIVTVE